MRYRRVGTALSVLALLASCGGGGGGNTGGGGDGPPIGGNPTPTPPPPPSSTAGCSLSERQNWVSAQMNEWYLFPETLPASLNPSGFSTVDAYLDALTATARSQGRDRFFTYITSIKEENAFFNSGSSAGFGFRLSYDNGARRVFIAETFEGTTALAANVDRGSEILAIGTSTGNLQSVSDLMAAGGPQSVINALGPNDPGVTRVLRVRDQTGATRDVSLSKTDYTLTPVSSRYGAKILDDNGRKVGYVNLRTFISTADPALRNAFAQFKAQGVSEVIVDFRYNGGGLVSIAELMGDLMGANRSTSDVFSITAFRPSKSQFNETRRFQPKSESIAPTKIAFIGTGGSASASELVINSFIPYLGTNMALVGSNTFGKPVGQIALDRTACDDRLRVVAFATQNRDGQGDYFQGLATKVPRTCQAADDITKPLGDPQEASVARALDFLAGRSCSAIAGVGAKTQSIDKIVEERLDLLSPTRPSTVQREVPGSF
jgi:C-terminal processing protease CtpA/Prc